LRNVGIRSKEQLFHYASSGSWPKVIVNMVNHESHIPRQLLKFGPVSKLAMGISYLFNRGQL